MALGLFGHRVFTMGGTVAFIYGMALFGSTYLVPVFMQEALHLPPSQAGAVLLPAGLVLAVTIPIAGRFADRVAVSKMVTAGLGLIAVAVLALLNGMVHLRGDTIGLGLALLACSVVATIGFVLHQRRGARPLMVLGLFGHRVFTMGGLVAFIYGMALFGSTYLVPVFMQEALHLPPSQAGAVLLPAGLVLALTIPIAGRFADRVAVSKMVTAGLALLAASFYLMLGVGVATSLLLITTWATVGRIGLVGNVLEWRLRTHATEPIVAYHETFALVGTLTAAAIVAAWRMTPPRHAAAHSVRPS